MWSELITVIRGWIELWMYSRHGMLLCNMLFKGIHGYAFSETFRKKWFPEFSRIYDNHFLSLIIIYKLKVLLVQNGLMSSRLLPVTSFLWQPCCELFSWIWNLFNEIFFLAVVAQCEETARCLFLRGKALNVMPDYDPLAQDSLSRAVKLDPKLVEAWNCLGECYWKCGQVEAARNCFVGALNHVS